LINNYPRLRVVVGAVTKKKIRENESQSFSARQAEDGYYYDVFNSALMIDRSAIVQIGHKSILVSGVEKMPFQKYFSFLGNHLIQIGGQGGSFNSASEPTVFIGANSDKIGSLICFESVFGEFAGSMINRGANLIFIMTNDGWWKDSPGVQQHFAYARLRAVETRRDIVRSANTGISGIINARGDVLAKTDMNSYSAISAQAHINETITFYVSWGDYLGRASFLLSCLIIIYLVMGGFKQRGQWLKS
jgi:apolipoprotein N-acyltransferase